MSAINTIKVTCPKCNKEVEVTVHGSVNLALDKELVTPLINGVLVY